MTEVIIQASENVARSLQNLEPATAESDEFLRVVHEFGAPLEALHPGEEDPLLLQYFRVQVTDPAMVTATIDKLRNVRGVQSVYVKPPDAAP